MAKVDSLSHTHLVRNELTGTALQLRVDQEPSSEELRREKDAVNGKGRKRGKIPDVKSAIFLNPFYTLRCMRAETREIRHTKKWGCSDELMRRAPRAFTQPGYNTTE